jgi:phosphoglycolate phosphatase-like HAD superfamily hydrolase
MAEAGLCILPEILARGKGLLFPDVESTLLSLLDKGVKIGIGTASPRASLDAIAEVTGLNRIFSVSLSVEDVGNVGKPDPDLFLEVARRLSARPQESMVVGDGDRDMEAGKRGCMGLTVQFVYSERQRYSEHADLSISRFDQLLTLL